ncbi:hypothetical protein GCM10027299_28960 [Larkinella ripae]
MKFGFDISELRKIDRALAGSVKTVTDKRLAGSAMRKALKPMMGEMKRQAPVGKYAPKRGVRVAQGLPMRQGGGTRADIRIKIVRGEAEEVVRGLVGVSKERGKAGRRTHLITRRNKNRRVANDFIKRTLRRKIEETTELYGRAVLSVVKGILKRI